MRRRAAPAGGAIVAALLVAGTVLRFAGLGRQSFWHDEIHSVLNAWGPHGGGFALAALNPHGSLYLVLLGAWTRLVGTDESAVRVLSALLGSLGLVIFHRVARRWLSRGAAVFALALLAFSPYHVWYSQEARNYALLFDTGLLAVAAFAAERERRTPASFALALVTGVAACLSNMAGFFLFPLEAVWLAAARDRVRYPWARFVLLVAVSAVVLSPWIVAGARTTGRPRLRVDDASSPVPIAKGEAPPGLLSVPFTFFDFSVGHSMGPTVDELKQRRMRAVIPHLPLLVPVGAAFAIAAALGAAGVRRGRRAALFAWLGTPVLLMAAVSFVNLKAPNSRYALLAFPPYLLLLAGGVAALRAAPVRAALGAALLVPMLLSDVASLRDPHYWKPDARSAGRLLAREARRGDAVIVYALDEPIRYYTPDSIAFLAPPPAAFASDSAGARWLEAATGTAARVWIVQCESWWADRDDRFLATCGRARAREAAWAFPQLPVYRFGPRTGESAR